ncbi:hypothetical protein V5F49_05070 [Xanthobacter sp. V3C-3]|uniref:hypothetical protein n=1 Tax=Xanthobacter lutulentifluminis TaxID=3119935 RepID=UPI003726A6B8
MSSASMAERSALVTAVLDLEERGGAEPLHFASPADLNGLVPIAAHCHDNARRFCEANPGYTAVGGWIVLSRDASGSYYLVRHSVVCDPAGKLICVTLAASDQHTLAGPFVRHDPQWGDFDSFGSHIIFAAGIGVLAS